MKYEEMNDPVAISNHCIQIGLIFLLRFKKTVNDSPALIVDGDLDDKELIEDSLSGVRLCKQAVLF